ncbi:MAG: hypothetical protein H8D63_00570 [Parcubacteria group bacterium]|nr:hypothetical protein [Parcubacteria group bacterium]
MKASIKEMGQKIKGVGEKARALLGHREIVLSILIILIGVVSFELGYLSRNDSVSSLRVLPPLTRESNDTSASTAQKNSYVPQTAAVGAVGAVSGSYVASKNGSKYHYPWCSGAKRIKDENKIWFDTVEQARAADYTPAANCPGLE